jgi:hypothetical protein
LAINRQGAGLRIDSGFRPIQTKTLSGVVPFQAHAPARDSSDRTNVDDFHRSYAFLADNGLHRLAEHVGVAFDRKEYGINSDIPFIKSPIA